LSLQRHSTSPMPSAWSSLKKSSSNANSRSRKGSRRSELLLLHVI
jgi:hypothetical protein